MTQLNLLQNHLRETYQKWSALSDSNKKQKINLILPFIQLNSYLDAIAQNENSRHELEDFGNEYERIYGVNIREMNKSDIAPQLLARIEETQERGEKLNQEEQSQLLQYEDKYIHAHNRVMFNYGSFLKIARDNSVDEPKKEEISNQIQTLKNTENPAEFLPLLSEINRNFELEKYSAAIPKDDLENHALLNQMTSYALNLAQTSQILLDENSFTKTLEMFEPSATKFAAKRNVKIPDLSEFSSTLKDKGIEMTVGLESEFLLNSLEKKYAPKSETEKNIAIKKILADINARRKMQTKYGFEPTLPEIDDMTPLLSSTPKEGGIGRADFKPIVENIKKQTDELYKNTPEILRDHDGEVQEIERLVANFTEAESFFYKLFFLEDFAILHKVEMDDIYDPSKSREENFRNTWNLIKENRFHEKLLDMIQAHEIAVGPHDVSEILQEKNSVFEKMRLLANQSGASLDDANVQVNSAFTIKTESGEKENILLPKIIAKENGEIEIEFNALGRQFLQLMEEAVAELGEVAGVLRQDKVNTSLDRNKVVAKQLENTDFRKVNPDFPAFLNHKILAAKNSPLRLSFINDKVAVVELRLVGNNTHFAKFDEAQNLYLSGIDFVAEEFLPRVSQKIGQFVDSKTKEKLVELYRQKVSVNHQGQIEGLNQLQAPRITLDKIFDPEKQLVYNPYAPALKVALIPYPEATNPSGERLQPAINELSIN